MIRISYSMLLLAALPLSLVATSHPATALEAGKYEVSVRLELPHIEDMSQTKVTKLCLGSQDQPTYGIKVLTDNNPLTKCTASNVHMDGNSLTFEIQCPGTNSAYGSAKFTLADQSFSGAIYEKMGGKNMTMTERQTGHRVGSCN